MGLVKATILGGMGVYAVKKITKAHTEKQQQQYQQYQQPPPQGAYAPPQYQQVQAEYYQQSPQQLVQQQPQQRVVEDQAPSYGEATGRWQDEMHGANGRGAEKCC